MSELETLYLCPGQAVAPVDSLLLPGEQSAIALGQQALCQVLTALMNPGKIVAISAEMSKMVGNANWETAIGMIARESRCRYVIDLQMTKNGVAKSATIRFETLE